MKILFLIPYPTEGASNRIRVEQYIPYLESRGAVCRIRPFVNSAFYKILYLPHCYFKKIFWFLICTANRLLDIIRALRYDIVFIHREAHPFGGPIIESILYRIGKPIIFDFDDSIFLPSTSKHNIYIDRFKRPDKISKIIRMSSKVIVGNEHLKIYALRYNKDVIVIPSSIDTEKYLPKPKTQDKKEVVIGWIGSDTTKDFLYDIKDVFLELSNRYRDLVIKLVGAKFYNFKLDNCISKEWSLHDELKDLHSFDIGVMPMPDNEWTRGKCGFKAILYMASGIPVVASPVGVNSDIVEDGVTGYLAKDNREWIEDISRLIEDKALRERMGAFGRRRVERDYSVKANAIRLIQAIQGVHHE